MEKVQILWILLLLLTFSTIWSPVLFLPILLLDLIFFLFFFGRRKASLRFFLYFLGILLLPLCLKFLVIIFSLFLPLKISVINYSASFLFLLPLSLALTLLLLYLEKQGKFSVGIFLIFLLIILLFEIGTYSEPCGYEDFFSGEAERCKCIGLTFESEYASLPGILVDFPSKEYRCLGMCHSCEVFKGSISIDEIFCNTSHIKLIIKNNGSAIISRGNWLIQVSKFNLTSKKEEILCQISHLELRPLMPNKKLSIVEECNTSIGSKLVITVYAPGRMTDTENCTVV
ncbi:hypothetical protein DRN63_05435 [Nanoarchaeota archaeon]|nr:MAG: hypothetical protein DRN63_05435 [Nanoarchaeota archaeon]